MSLIEFKHTLKDFERFAHKRRQLCVPATECLVAIETADDLLVDFLPDRGYLVHLIPFRATRGYCNRQRSTDAHTDDTDVALLASAGLDRLTHRDRMIVITGSSFRVHGTQDPGKEVPTESTD